MFNTSMNKSSHQTKIIGNVIHIHDFHTTWALRFSNTCEGLIKMPSKAVSKLYGKYHVIHHLMMIS